ncbi:hypothetical protein E2562_011119 [Oryza meyeriana var. granulata]|uniref:Uncharacterized protein n=1 Tax=Oryza meyeriana var. granulata TaxID=110450 RepID=A0A6G1DG50_9ORYZ|nr:hypothetical protein E2562_011119 [Oryza meyeriana var. granulata]
MAMAAAGDKPEMVELWPNVSSPAAPPAPRLPICAATSLTTDVSQKTASAWSCEEGISRAKTTPMSTSAMGISC